MDEEIAINFAAPIHLSMLLASHLAQQEHPAILNVRSGLGGPGLHTFGVPIDEFLEVAVPRIEAGEADVAHGFAQILHYETASRPDPIFTGFLCTSYGRNPGSDGNPAGQLRWRRNGWRKRP